MAPLETTLRSPLHHFYYTDVLIFISRKNLGGYSLFALLSFENMHLCIFNLEDECISIWENQIFGGYLSRRRFSGYNKKWDYDIVGV